MVNRCYFDELLVSDYAIFFNPRLVVIVCPNSVHCQFILEMLCNTSITANLNTFYFF